MTSVQNSTSPGFPCLDDVCDDGRSRNPVYVGGRSHNSRNLQYPLIKHSKLRDFVHNHDVLLDSQTPFIDQKTMATSSSKSFGTILDSLQLNSDWTLLHSQAEPSSTMVGRSVGPVVSSASLQDVCEEGSLQTALQRLNHMAEEGVFIPDNIFSHLLERCIDKNDLSLGKRVYLAILKSRQELDVMLGSQLILMFASFGTMVEALEVFKKVPEPNTVIWGIIISAHVSNGCSSQAIDLYNQWRSSEAQPNKQIFILVLQACSARALSARSVVDGLQQGRKVHAHMVEMGHAIDIYVGNTLIDMYSKCKSLQEAYQVFHSLLERDVVSWNALITGNVHNGCYQEALYLFTEMRRDFVEPNRVTLLSVLKACSSVNFFELGEQVYTLIVELGLDQSISLGSTLIDMCTKCGMLDYATTVFNRLSKRNDVTWSVLIEGYVEHGLCLEALQIFQQMQLEHVIPTSFTFVSVFRACSGMGALEEGQQAYSQVCRLGIESSLFVSNSLIDMYGRCGSLEEARCVFDGVQERDAVTWSALISGYVQHGHGSMAIQLFESMENDRSIEADPVAFATVLKGCATWASLEHRRQMHARVVESGFESNAYVGSAIIDMYAKAGQLTDADIEFCRLPAQSVASWSAIMAGYSQQDRAQDALLLFKKMELDGVEPNGFTFVCAIQACSSTAALEIGKELHVKFINLGLRLDVFVGSALIDMYSRCGCLQDALAIFQKVPANNVVTWNALMAGFILHNDQKSAFNIYAGMVQAHVELNDATFLSLISACGRVGLVEEGCSYFKTMVEKHRIFANSLHLNALVDLLGRAGLLLEAEELLEISPLAFDSVGWTALLSSCKQHGCLSVGKQCFNHMIASSRANAGTFMLMSSIYQRAGMQEDAAKIEDMKGYLNAWKKPAKACIEVNKRVHEFANGDRSHPQWHEISAKLKALRAHMSNEGYKYEAQAGEAEKADSEKEKAKALCGHSEKLAIAFGLINMPAHVPIRVTKNLRMCDDCHTMAKMVSKIEMREIFVIDTYCAHHFEGSLCSCEGQQL